MAHGVYYMRLTSVKMTWDCRRDIQCVISDQDCLIFTTQAWKQQTRGDPSGQTSNYRGITLLYNDSLAIYGIEYLLNSKY